MTDLAQCLGYSDRQLRRRVLDLFGKTPSELLLERRLAHAHGLIENRCLATVAEVARAVGLSPAYFSRRYRHAYRCKAIVL